MVSLKYSKNLFDNIIREIIIGKNDHIETETASGAPTRSKLEPHLTDEQIEKRLKQSIAQSEVILSFENSSKNYHHPLTTTKIKNILNKIGEIDHPVTVDFSHNSFTAAQFKKLHQLIEKDKFNQLILNPIKISNRHQNEFQGGYDKFLEKFSSNSHEFIKTCFYELRREMKDRFGSDRLNGHKLYGVILDINSECYVCAECGLSILGLQNPCEYEEAFLRNLENNAVEEEKMVLRKKPVGSDSDIYTRMLILFK